MEPWAIAVVVIAGAVVVIGIARHKVVQARERREGTGSWKPYGPGATDEHIQFVNLARKSFAEGVKAYREAGVDAAASHWQEARNHDARAVIGLGVVAWEQGLGGTARRLWRQASLRGETIGEILIRLADPKTSGTETTATLAAESWLRSNELRPIEDDFWLLIGLAKGYGFTDYARELVLLAEDLRYKGYLRRSMRF